MVGLYDEGFSTEFDTTEVVADREYQFNLDSFLDNQPMVDFDEMEETPYGVGAEKTYIPASL